MNILKTSRYKSSDPDINNYIYSNSGKQSADAIDLRQWGMLIENQQQVGSCTGNALVSAYELMTQRLYPEHYTELSRMFVYYNARIYEDTVTWDSGASIKSGLRGLKTYGVCKESIWPYTLNNLFAKPSDEAYAEAKHRQITKYERLVSIADAIDAINNYYPVVSGIEVFESFYDLTEERSIITEDVGSSEGHAVLLVGYDSSKKVFIVENSFGKNWGDAGYFYMPFDYYSEYMLEQWIFDIPDLSKELQIV
jgi:hypothetical protein